MTISVLYLDFNGPLEVILFASFLLKNVIFTYKANFSTSMENFCFFGTFTIFSLYSFSKNRLFDIKLMSSYNIPECLNVNVLEAFCLITIFTLKLHKVNKWGEKVQKLSI